MKIRTTAICVVLSLFVACAQAESTKRERSKPSRPITNPKFDASAERVELFAGMEKGTLETKVVANGPEGGSLLISNKTDEPLTVDLPKSFVTVHVLKQFGQQGGGFGGGGGLGGGGLGGQQGGQQAQGGGLGGGGLGGGGLGGGGLGGGGFGGGQQGGGFFSIPPEKTVKVPYKSVCLNHGKPDPTPRAHRVLVKTEEYTEDPVLRELIGMVATGRLAPQAAQAAVWNRTDKMSWQELAAKFSYGPLGNKLPYFSRTDLRGAQMLSATAVGRIRERGENPDVPEQEPVRGRRVSQR